MEGEAGGEDASIVREPGGESGSEGRDARGRVGVVGSAVVNESGDDGRARVSGVGVVGSRVGAIPSVEVLMVSEGDIAMMCPILAISTSFLIPQKPNIPLNL